MLREDRENLKASRRQDHHSLQNDKILHLSKLKVFGYQHFLLFTQSFQKAFSIGSLTHPHTMTPFDGFGKEAF